MTVPGDDVIRAPGVRIVNFQLDANGALIVTGGGSAGATPTGSAGAPNAAVVTVQGLPGGAALATLDAAADAALGTPGDGAWGGSGGSSVVAALKALYGLLAGTLRVAEAPFVPVPGATVALTAGPTATTAPVALPAVVASTYRARNPATSASPVAWRLGPSAVVAATPTPYAVAGTGGAVGDKALDSGGVEVFSLTAAQQASLAAGSLYLSAITPAGGSATLYFTPGVAGA